MVKNLFYGLESYHPAWQNEFNRAMDRASFSRAYEVLKKLPAANPSDLSEKALRLNVLCRAYECIFQRFELVDSESDLLGEYQELGEVDEIREQLARLDELEARLR